MCPQSAPCKTSLPSQRYPGGDCLGGGLLPGRAGRVHKVGAVAGAGQRNIAAAMVVATMNFSEDPNVLVMIIVYSLITMIVMTPLAGELGKRAKAKAAEAA